MSLKLGTQYMIVGSSPDAAREILKTKDRILSGRCVPKSVPGTKEELDHSSLGWAEECNENWKFLCTLCRAELFSNRALESQARLREKSLARLVNFVGSKEGEELKIAELVFATVFNVLGNAVMSKDFTGLEESGQVRSIIRGTIEVDATPNLSEFYPFLSKFDLQGIRRKEPVLMAKMCALWEPIVEERRKGRINSSSRHHQDFLDTLLDNDFTNKKINQLFMELFSAGTDTNTGTIEWTMAELLRKPEAMKNVRLEIDTTINEDFPKNSKEIHLPYLDACIKETLRLHPPAPLLLPHPATETCQVMGYTIPRNAQVVVNFWAIGRDASIWDDPLEFIPERFLTSILDFKGKRL